MEFFARHQAQSQPKYWLWAILEMAISSRRPPAQEKLLDHYCSLTRVVFRSIYRTGQFATTFHRVKNLLASLAEVWEFRRPSDWAKFF